MAMNIKELKPKVFIWQGRFSGGGAEKVTLELARACRRAGVEPVLGVFKKDSNFDFEQIEVPAPFPKRLLGYNSVFASIWMRLTRKLRDFDIVLAHVEGFWRGRKNIYVAHQAGDIQKAFYAKGAFSKLVYLPVYLISVWGLRTADLVFYATDTVKNFLIRKKVNGEILMTSSFMSFDGEVDKEESLLGNLDILFVGNDQKVKNLKSLVEAVHGEPGMSLDIIGVTGSNEENIYYHGWQEDVPGFIKKADLVCIPSFFEGFPLVSLEALSLGTPVLISRAALPYEIELWTEETETDVISIKQDLLRIKNSFSDIKKKALLAAPIIRETYETEKVTDREIKNMIIFWERNK